MTESALLPFLHGRISLSMRSERLFKFNHEETKTGRNDSDFQFTATASGEKNHLDNSRKTVVHIPGLSFRVSLGNYLTEHKSSQFPFEREIREGISAPPPSIYK
jgi:hypothetical protein